MDSLTHPLLLISTFTKIPQMNFTFCSYLGRIDGFSKVPVPLVIDSDVELMLLRKRDLQQAAVFVDSPTLKTKLRFKVTGC